MSNIAQIYDKLIADEKLKNGTKYERLAAVVFKILDQSDTVIHDLRLRGDGKTARHQIDVTVEKNGNKKRILIECKEYEKVVGIKVIRDFYGAVSQIKPDEAFVITTKGFTREAIHFAKDENIRLAILREAKDDDWEGLIRKININLICLFMDTPQISFVAFDEQEKDRIYELLKDHWGETQNIWTKDAYFYDEDFQPISNFQDMIAPIVNAAPREVGKVTKGRHEFGRKLFVKILSHFVAIKGFDYEFNSYAIERNIVVDDGGKVASLLLKILDNDHKMLFFEEDLEKWTFDEDGEVIPKTI